MRNVIIFLTVWYASLFAGCSSTSKNTESFDAKVEYVGDWVSEKSGLIQVSVQAITHVVIYSQTDLEDRAEVIAKIHAVAENLDALVSAGKVDPREVRQALKVKEEYVDVVLQSVATLYAAEYENLKKNGYANLAINILQAVSRGVANGTVQ